MVFVCVKRGHVDMALVHLGGHALERLHLEVVRILLLVGYKILDGREHIGTMRTVDVYNISDFRQVIFVVSNVHRLLSAHGADKFSVDKPYVFDNAGGAEFVSTV